MLGLPLPWGSGLKFLLRGSIPVPVRTAPPCRLADARLPPVPVGSFSEYRCEVALGEALVRLGGLCGALWTGQPCRPGRGLRSGGSYHCGACRQRVLLSRSAAFFSSAVVASLFFFFISTCGFIEGICLCFGFELKTGPVCPFHQEKQQLLFLMP